jgi:hypothetical protein
MSNTQTASEWMGIVGIVAAWVLLMLWLRRSQNARAAAEGKTEELKRRRGVSFAWGLIGAGVILAGVIAGSWRNIPPGNEPVTASMLIMGALCALFGVYRLYRLKR